MFWKIFTSAFDIPVRPSIFFSSSVNDNIIGHSLIKNKQKVYSDDVMNDVLVWGMGQGGQSWPCHFLPRNELQLLPLLTNQHELGRSTRFQCNLVLFPLTPHVLQQEHEVQKVHAYFELLFLEHLYQVLLHQGFKCCDLNDKCFVWVRVLSDRIAGFLQYHAQHTHSFLQVLETLVRRPISFQWGLDELKNTKKILTIHDPDRLEDAQLHNNNNPTLSRGREGEEWGEGFMEAH